ncbi:hypothetical protein SNEBB_006890 [Seison nebaliae]|nr:hypothetical protein SNEBB_006890 [Seison nebaliae]
MTNKAEKLIEEAEKKLKQSTGLMTSLFGDKTSKIEDASALYVRAGNAYKMEGEWNHAGNCFLQAAQLQVKQTNMYDAGNQYVEAGNCYRKTNPIEATKMIKEAIDIYTDMGKFSIAAKHHQTCGEMFEEANDTDSALTCYEKAGQYFKGENQNAQANKCFLKVADTSAFNGNYSRAIKIYEDIAMASIDNRLLRYGAKDHFFKALICHLNTDVLNCKQAMQRYQQMYSQIVDTREWKLLKNLVEAVESDDSEKFSVELKSFDKMSRLDSWQTKLFLSIKKLMPSTNGAEGGDQLFSSNKSSEQNSPAHQPAPPMKDDNTMDLT